MSPGELVHDLNYGASVMSERAVDTIHGILENPGLAGTNIVAREDAFRRYIEQSDVRPEYRERVFNEILSLAGFTPEQYEQHKLAVGIGIQFPFMLGGGGPRPTPAITPRVSAPLPAPGSVWRLGPATRGNVIAAALGQNLPARFPAIDRVSPSGVVTSIKSVDLNAATYQRAATLDRVLRGHIDRIAGFRGHSFADHEVLAGQISGRALDIVLPQAGNSAQQAVIAEAVRYGEFRRVIVNIIIFP
jgi:hypothetical protein